MQVFIGIAYFIVGIVQFFAIVDGIGKALDINGFFAWMIGMFLTYIPLIGSIAGVYGATKAWHWELWQAVILFFWYIPFVAVFVIFDMLDRRR
nr:hypothetical protein [uncultured Cohaesibacter sp.]